MIGNDKLFSVRGRRSGVTAKGAIGVPLWARVPAFLKAPIGPIRMRLTSLGNNCRESTSTNTSTRQPLLLRSGHMPFLYAAHLSASFRLCSCPPVLRAVLHILAFHGMTSTRQGKQEPSQPMWPTGANVQVDFYPPSPPPDPIPGCPGHYESSDPQLPRAGCMQLNLVPPPEPICNNNLN